MAIRIRRVSGILVALCAAKSKHQNADIYLDDEIDGALRIKLEEDWKSEDTHIIDTLRKDNKVLRDALEEMNRYARDTKTWTKCRIGMIDNVGIGSMTGDILDSYIDTFAEIATTALKESSE